MLSNSIILLLISLLAGILGFAVVSGIAATVAKVVFFVFLILFFVSLVRGKRNPPARQF